MNCRKAEMLREQAREAVQKHPELSRRTIYKMAKKDYLQTPRTQRKTFSIFERT